MPTVLVENVDSAYSRSQTAARQNTSRSSRFILFTLFHPVVHGFVYRALIL
jgi:hypothetical protein